jgi:hypothetical protein
VYIHEAIQARTEEKPHIRRKRWVNSFGTVHAARIIPTSSPDGMIVDSRTAKGLYLGWQPTAEDLVADDWEMTF